MEKGSSRPDTTETKVFRTPEEYLNDSTPTCPVCKTPSNDIACRKDPREWMSTYGMDTFESCKSCWLEARADN